MIDLLVKEGTTDGAAWTVAVVRGPTFDVKDRIKEAGFRWGYDYALYVAAPEGERSQDALETRYGKSRKCWSLHRHGSAEENAGWLDGLRRALGLMPPVTEPGSRMEENDTGTEIPF